MSRFDLLSKERAALDAIKKHSGMMLTHFNDQATKNMQPYCSLGGTQISKSIAERLIRCGAVIEKSPALLNGETAQTWIAVSDDA